MIHDPQIWVTATSDNTPADESWIPLTHHRVSAWEPFATAITYYGQAGTSIGESSPGCWASVIVWRCVAEPVGADGGS